MRSTVFLVAVLFVGCGDNAVAPITQSSEIQAPVLSQLSPNVIELGRPISIAGQHFANGNSGTLDLVLDGVFIGEDGSRTPTKDRRFRLRNRSAALAELVFETVALHPHGDVLGTFEGSAWLVKSVREEGVGLVELESKPIDITFAFGPSIIVDRLQAIGNDARQCQYVTAGTLEDREIAMEVRVLGLGRASAATPWQATFRFNSPQVRLFYTLPNVLSANEGFRSRRGYNLDEWVDEMGKINTGRGVYTTGVRGTVNSVVSEAIDIFQTGRLDPNQVKEADSKRPNQLVFDITSGDTASITPRSRIQFVDVQPPVELGTREYSQSLALYRVKVGKLTDEGTPFPRQFSDTAVIDVQIDTPDQTLSRVVSFNYSTPIELRKWQGERRLLQIEPHIRVDNAIGGGCFSGGKLGGDYRFTVTSAVSRRRDFNVRYDQNRQTASGHNLGLLTYGQYSVNETLSQTFDISASESVSLDQSSGVDFTTHILPNWWAASYIQPSKWELTTDIVENNVCGEGKPVGQGTLIDWMMMTEIGHGPTCPPEPHQLRAPCNGDCPDVIPGGVYKQ